jgi:predicted dienelactone hydrolase
VAALAVAELAAAVVIAPSARSRPASRPPLLVASRATPPPPLPTALATAPEAPATTVPPAAAPTGVGEINVDFVDSTRPTVDQGQTISSSRNLPTLVMYPAVGPSGDNQAVGAPAARGPWPLIVFAHGYAVTALTYVHLLHNWAAAGFVVAAPAFPLQTAGGPLDEADLANEPADISAVIGGLLQQSASGSGPLAHLIDGAHIAVAGHSDGAVAALATAFGREDTRIGPVICMSGAARAGIPHPDARHPLLIVQGNSDDIDSPDNAYQVYNDAGAPRVYLDLLGAGHLPPIADDTPWRPVVESVTLAFLRHYFGQGGTIAALAAAGTHPGVSIIGGQP